MYFPSGICIPATLEMLCWDPGSPDSLQELPSLNPQPQLHIIGLSPRAHLSGNTFTVRVAPSCSVSPSP